MSSKKKNKSNSNSNKYQPPSDDTVINLTEKGEDYINGESENWVYDSDGNRLRRRTVVDN